MPISTNADRIDLTDGRIETDVLPDFSRTKLTLDRLQ